MKKLYPADYRVSGDRCVELPWVRSKVHDIKGVRIADFGTIVRTRYGKRLGWPAYGIPPGNDVHAFDVDKSLELKKQYTQLDLLKAERVPGAPFDLGICVSAMEHFGFKAYGEPEQCSRGDQVGLRAMYKSLTDGGRLLVTVPCGRGMILNNWIREYSPEQLEALLHKAGCYRYTIDYFTYIGTWWWQTDVGLLVREQKAKPPDHTVITGLACIEIVRGK